MSPVVGMGNEFPYFSRGVFISLALGLGPRCPGDFYPAFEEEVDGGGTQVACGACDENVAKRRFLRTCCTLV